MKAARILKIFLFTIFFITLSLSQVKITAKGSAVIKGDGQDANFKARSSAINNAYQTALEKAILKIIPQQLYNENDSKIKDELFSNAKAFIKDEEILDEDIDNGKYIVSLEVLLDEKKLSESLNSVINISTGSLSNMVLAVAIDELILDKNNYEIETHSGAASLIGTKISEELLKKGITLKSEDIIEQIRKELVGSNGNLSSLLIGENDDIRSELAAKMISGKYNIDAVVFGTAKITYIGKYKDGLETATASANIRVIEVTTGKILAAAVSNETGIAKSMNEACAAASRRLGAILAPKLTNELHSKWLSILNEGTDYCLNFQGSIDTHLKDVILTNLRSIKNISNAVKKNEPKDVQLQIELTYKGRPDQLKKDIYNTFYNISELSGIREEITIGNSIGYFMEPPLKKRSTEASSASLLSFQKPTVHAVIIGISEYADKSMNLNAATSDAELIKSYCISKEGISVAEANLKFISNNNATKANILNSIKEYSSKTGVNDLIILYFAGHGWAEDKEMYFLVHDTKKDDIPKTAISQKELQDVLQFAPAKRQIFIADACHSGAMSLAYMTQVSLSNLPDTRSVDPRSTLMKNIIGSSQGLAVMTAASANQQAMEGPQWGGHGLFTYTLIEGLKGEADLNKDKLITINEAFIYTVIKMSQETEGKQTPTVMGPLDLPLGILR